MRRSGIYVWWLDSSVIDRAEPRAKGEGADGNADALSVGAPPPLGFPKNMQDGKRRRRMLGPTQLDQVEGWRGSTLTFSGRHPLTAAPRHLSKPHWIAIDVFLSFSPLNGVIPEGGHSHLSSLFPPAPN